MTRLISPSAPSQSSEARYLAAARRAVGAAAFDAAVAAQTRGAVVPAPVAGGSINDRLFAAIFDAPAQPRVSTAAPVVPVLYPATSAEFEAANGLRDTTGRPVARRQNPYSGDSVQHMMRAGTRLIHADGSDLSTGLVREDSTEVSTSDVTAATWLPRDDVPSLYWHDMEAARVWSDLLGDAPDAIALAAWAAKRAAKAARQPLAATAPVSTNPFAALSALRR